MGKAESVKGAAAERDAARLLADLLGLPEGGPDCPGGVRRMLGAGRADDVGDIANVPGLCVQVANRRDLGGVLRHKALECEKQQANGGMPFGVTLAKLQQPGGQPQQWRFIMTPDQFAELYRWAVYAINPEDLKG